MDEANKHWSCIFFNLFDQRGLATSFNPSQCTTSIFRNCYFLLLKIQALEQIHLAHIVGSYMFDIPNKTDFTAPWLIWIFKVIIQSECL